MSRLLQVAPGLELPLDAVTQKSAFLGRTGSGKTYAATKVAEEMLDAGAQVIALDPVGTWYGLRLSGDGKSSGISIPVLGGLHGDVPLEESSGAMIADLVVDRGISAVLDVSQFESDASKARFAHRFADRFFFRKKAAPSAVHLFLEECQEFLPQNPGREDALMLHVFTRLWKLGRNFGVGGSLISQRPQEVNKKALNMTECLFAFQMTGIHERKTVEAWIADKGLDLDVMGELPKLPIGTAHVWSPQWLQISKRVTISKKRTFNTSSTPEVGKAAKARELAPIDLEALRTEMAATIERAKADDPRELRKRIAELERELKGARVEKPAPAPEVRRVEVPIMTSADMDQLRALTDATRQLHTTSIELFDAALKRATAPVPTVHPSTPEPAEGHRTGRSSLTRGAPASMNGRDDARVTDYVTGKGLPRGERSMLSALMVNYPEPTRGSKAALIAGYSPRSSTFRNILSGLRVKGLIAGDREGLSLTEKGHAAIAGAYEPPPSGAELHDHWLRFVGRESLPGRVLRQLLDVYPRGLGRDQLARAAASTPDSSTYRNALSKLRTLELIDGRGELRASPELFS